MTFCWRSSWCSRCPHVWRRRSPDRRGCSRTSRPSSRTSFAAQGQHRAQPATSTFRTDQMMMHRDESERHRRDQPNRKAHQRQQSDHAEGEAHRVHHQQQHGERYLTHRGIARHPLQRQREQQAKDVDEGRQQPAGHIRPADCAWPSRSAARRRPSEPGSAPESGSSAPAR